MAENEEQDEAQKTEEPTPKRLQQSREEGQVPLSREVNNWVMLCAGTLIIIMMAGGTFQRLSDLMESYIARAHAIPSMPGGIAIALGEGMWQVILVLALPFFCVILYGGFIVLFCRLGRYGRRRR